MGMISQKTIDEIKNAADILDVVGEFVAIQPAGKNHKGLCPFHNEKTPSFFVSKERNWFHCFGCGEKGDSITFIMKYKNMSYVESLKYLAEKYNIRIESDDSDVSKPNADRYYRINEEATQFFGLHLTNLEKGKPALDYLKNAVSISIRSSTLKSATPPRKLINYIPISRPSTKRSICSRSV